MEEMGAASQPTCVVGAFGGALVLIVDVCVLKRMFDEALQFVKFSIKRLLKA